MRVTFAYDAFGRGKPAGTSFSAGWDSRMRFQAAPRDPASGSYTIGPRIYDPSTYRFVGIDTMLSAGQDRALQMDPLTGNRYLYAGANPVDYIDDGHGPCLFGKIGWCKKKSKKPPKKQTGKPRLWCTDSYQVWVCGEKDPGKLRTGWTLGPGAKDGWNALVFDALIAASIIELQYMGRAPSTIGDDEVDLGRKLEYFFGRATGTAHNVQRSQSMLRQLESIGLRDTAANRNYLASVLQATYRNPNSVVATQKNGYVVRESLLMGPNGSVKLETIWDGNKLITGVLYGGKAT